MGRMGDLTWDEGMAALLDPMAVSALPELRVVGTTAAADWQALFDLVAERGWRYEYMQDWLVQEPPLPRAADALAHTLLENCRLNVEPFAGMVAVFPLYEPGRIDFDVDLGEIQGQERLDAFCGFLAEIGRRLGKPVAMSAEREDGASAESVLGYDVAADRVVLLPEQARG